MRSPNRCPGDASRTGLRQSDTVKITLAQIGSGTDLAANLAMITASATAARGAGADVVMFPEYAMYEKHKVDDTFADAAQPLDGDFGTAVSRLAADLGIAIFAGMVEHNAARPGRPFNTLGAWSAEGELLGRHRKALLYDVGNFSESSFISPGDPDDISTVTVGDTVIGLQACYELRFPEISRRQVRAGATVLAVLSSWVPGPAKIAQWITLTTARAIENLCHVVAVTQAVPVSTGHSLAIGPDGGVLASLGSTPDQVTVSIDFAATKAVRANDPRALAVDV